MRFRPCIDIHGGQVKQIVGSSLKDAAGDPATNFVSDQPAASFAARYNKDGLAGGHVIMLGGSGAIRAANERQAAGALAAFPGGLHIGGGITADNAADWLKRGAGAVIVTSYVFADGVIHLDKLLALKKRVGREHLILDLSCRKKDGSYLIVTDRWQRCTTTELSRRTMESLAGHCAGFLVHAADAEGKCAGVAADLVAFLGEHAPLPVTYAGGVRSLEDLSLILDLGRGRVDFTVGSALDLFGGVLPYTDVLSFHRRLNI